MLLTWKYWKFEWFYRFSLIFISFAGFGPKLNWKPLENIFEWIWQHYFKDLKKIFLKIWQKEFLHAITQRKINKNINNTKNINLSNVIDFWFPIYFNFTTTWNKENILFHSPIEFFFKEEEENLNTK